MSTHACETLSNSKLFPASGDFPKVTVLTSEFIPITI